MKRLIAFVLAVDSLTVLMILGDYLRHSMTYASTVVARVVDGTYIAPEQYRIGIPFAAHFLSHLHFPLLLALVAIEWIPFPIALWLLWKSVEFSEMSALLLFCVVLQFPIPWIFPWYRPETLPTTLLLILLVRWGEKWPLVALIAVVQSLLRADVPVVVGLAFLFFPKRRLSGILCVVIACSIQILLKLRYPSARYDTSVIQLHDNFLDIHALYRIPMFLVALLPFFACLSLLRKNTLSDRNKICVLSSVLYLPLWACVGMLSEIRIFVPFLFLCVPVMAMSLNRWLVEDRTEFASAANGL